VTRLREECDSCGGTGLYCGFCEPAGTAVICIHCNGQGWVWHEYREFAGRKKRRGVKSISRSRGGFIATGVGACGASMTYEQFEQKFPVKA
jgi:hypothetical protein